MDNKNAESENAGHAYGVPTGGDTVDWYAELIARHEASANKAVAIAMTCIDRHGISPKDIIPQGLAHTREGVVVQMLRPSGIVGPDGQRQAAALVVVVPVSALAATDIDSAVAEVEKFARMVEESTATQREARLSVVH